MKKCAGWGLGGSRERGDEAAPIYSTSIAYPASPCTLTLVFTPPSPHSPPPLHTHKLHVHTLPTSYFNTEPNNFFPAITNGWFDTTIDGTYYHLRFFPQQVRSSSMTVQGAGVERVRGRVRVTAAVASGVHMPRSAPGWWFGRTPYSPLVPPSPPLLPSPSLPSPLHNQDGHACYEKAGGRRAGHFWHRVSPVGHGRCEGDGNKGVLLRPWVSGASKLNGRSKFYGHAFLSKTH